MKFNRVSDTARISKRWSVILAKVGGAVGLGWGALTAAGLVPTVPAWVAQVAAGVIFVCIAAAAYLKQGNLPEQTVKDDQP